MKSEKRIFLYLFLAITFLTVIPLWMAYFFGSDLISGVTQTKFDSNVDFQTIVSEYQKDLKKISHFDPQNEKTYKERFFELQNVKNELDSIKQLESKVHSIYFRYFYVGILIPTVLAIIGALTIAFLITKAYRELFNAYKSNLDQINEAKNFEQWRLVAKKLAHEIKNPLTPIEMMVTGLIPLFERKSSVEFLGILKETRNVVLEELSKLKRMVHHFSHFAKLPDPVRETTDFKIFLTSFIDFFKDSFPKARFDLKLNDNEFSTSIDKGLIRQVLTNLVSNGIEANPELDLVNFTISLTKNSVSNQLSLTIENNGKPLPNLDLIFTPYFSTKSSKNKDNMGLGLTIARKIMADHHGSLVAMASQNESGASFLLTLPLENNRSINGK